MKAVRGLWMLLTQSIVDAVQADGDFGVLTQNKYLPFSSAFVPFLLSKIQFCRKCRMVEKNFQMCVYVERRMFCGVLSGELTTCEMSVAS
jgi:hypothetical protein